MADWLWPCCLPSVSMCVCVFLWRYRFISVSVGVHATRVASQLGKILCRAYATGAQREIFAAHWVWIKRCRLSANPCLYIYDILFVPQLHCIYGSVYALEWRMLVAARRGWMLGTEYSYEVSAFRFSAFLWHAFGGGTKLNLPGIGAVNIIFNLNIKYCDVYCKECHFELLKKCAWTVLQLRNPAIFFV